MPRPARPPVLLAYATFVLIGIYSGSGGVLLVAQMSSYGVDRTTIGIMFFTGSAGFVLAGFQQRRPDSAPRLPDGPGHRRRRLRDRQPLSGHPAPLRGVLLVQLLLGYGTGVLESALNAYLAALPDARAQLNLLHAFFGVGALIGPVLAAWIVSMVSWTVVWLVLAAMPACRLSSGSGCSTRTGSACSTRPPAAVRRARRAGLPEPPAASRAACSAPCCGSGASCSARSSLRSTSASRSAWATGASATWCRRATCPGRSPGTRSAVLAGADRRPVRDQPDRGADRRHHRRMVYTCLIGVIAATMLAWLSPSAALASAALLLLGFFLGPIFPTTMAIVPQLTRAGLGPAAIGVLNAGAIIGGSALPWLAGIISQATGSGRCCPSPLALGALQFAAWRPLARRIGIPRQIGG